MDNDGYWAKVRAATGCLMATWTAIPRAHICPHGSWHRGLLPHLSPLRPCNGHACRRAGPYTPPSSRCPTPLSHLALPRVSPPQIGSRPVRPLSSVLLPPGQAEAILADCRDFLASEAWYAHRGIPYRRGYLLYGLPGELPPGPHRVKVSSARSRAAEPTLAGWPLVPHSGTGKTSLVTALAGELGCHLYVVSLSSPRMTDEALGSLLTSSEEGSILLLEVTHRADHGQSHAASAPTHGGHDPHRYEHACTSDYIASADRS